MAEKLPSAKELRAMPEADLRAQIERLRQDLWDHRLKSKEGAAQTTHRIPEAKHQIARIHTILREQRTPTTQG